MYVSQGFQFLESDNHPKQSFMIAVLIYCDENMVIRRLLGNFANMSKVKIMHFPLLATLKMLSLSQYFIVLNFSLVVSLLIQLLLMFSLCLLDFLYLRLIVFYYFQKALTHCFLKYSSTTFSFLLQFQLHMQYFTGNHFSLWNPCPVWGICYCCFVCVCLFGYFKFSLISSMIRSTIFKFTDYLLIISNLLMSLAKEFFIFVTMFLTFHRT